MHTKKLTLIVLAISAIFLLNNCVTSKKDKMTKELQEFIKKYEEKVATLTIESNIAYWNATISGKDEDYKKASDLQVKLSKVYNNKEDFAVLKKIKESGLIDDEILKRELSIIYNYFLGNQIDEKKLEALIQQQNLIEKKFNTFRAVVNGKQITDNDIEETLINSTKSDDVKAVWLASKKSGSNVADDVKKLVKMRNEAAKELGFNNYHEMSLSLDDQKPEEVAALFDELDILTRDVFAKQKDDIDNYLAARFKIDKKDLMPWHYQNRFFQEAPKIYKVDLDEYYKGKDLVKLTGDYYNCIGLGEDDILAKSDLFEKPGKNQHGYCMDVDKLGDIRILCNVKSNSKWMNTMLHESGHAVYDKYYDHNLPFSLRDPAHTFTTEAVAMMFGRFAANPQWLKDNGLIKDEDKPKIAEDCFKTLRLEQLVFSRWAQVMYRFEKSMYANPDQDLNKLWWDLVEKYQMLKRPADRNEPDWASKIHIATVPCYYHNYLLGELFASQMYCYIVKNIIKSDDYKFQSFSGNKEVGNFMKDKIFLPGKKFYWNDMIEKATGEKLTAKYYAKQFVN